MSWSGLKPSQFALQVIADGTTLQKRIVGDMLQGVVLQSPVDEGTYRGNHRVSINTPDNDYDETTDNSGVTTMNKGYGISSESKLGDLVYIQNNLPYGMALEHGHSGQAPHGVYTVTFAAVSEKYK